MTNNKDSNCNDFVEIIRDHFLYLFDDHEFDLIQLSERAFGEQCLLILESPSCRIRFIRERGGVLSAIGGLDAPLTWSQGLDDKGLWYAMMLTIDYVNGRARRTRKESLDLIQKFSERSFEENLDELSRQLKPAINEISKLFSEKSKKFSRQDLDLYIGY